MVVDGSAGTVTVVGVLGQDLFREAVELTVVDEAVAVDTHVAGSE